ncbi:MAG: CDP-alcohol phosphatidyltransferase family protein [Chloroflexi bacterium]|nr:MAG: CDP-alcohol phosphatidyltransferase family protein [Chloroflexota bacterium]
MSAADWLSSARLLLVPLIWLFALAGQSHVVGVGLIVAGLTDALDGHLARRFRQASVRGARLDAVADTVLMISVSVWLEILHPRILRDYGAIVAATGIVYATSVAVSAFTFRRIVDPRQMSSKIAGGLLYLFALVTLLVGDLEPPLLIAALVALEVSSLDTIVKATRTIHANASARRHRSQAPQAAKEVVNSTSPTPSTPSSAVPRISDIRP